MILATSTSGKFLGMFSTLEDAQTFQAGQKKRWFRTVRLSELDDTTTTPQTNWRTKSMPMFMFGFLLPIHNPYIVGGLLGAFALVLLWSPRPMRAVIPTRCNDPNVSWAEWIIQGCYLFAKKTTLKLRRA